MEDYEGIFLENIPGKGWDRNRQKNWESPEEEGLTRGPSSYIGREWEREYNNTSDVDW